MSDNGTRSDAGGSPPLDDAANTKLYGGTKIDDYPNLISDNKAYEHKGIWYGYQNAWHSIPVWLLQQLKSQDKWASIREQGWDAWLGFICAKYESGNKVYDLNKKRKHTAVEPTQLPNGKHIYPPVGTFQLLGDALERFIHDKYKEEFDKAGIEKLDKGSDARKAKIREIFEKQAKNDPNFVKSEYEFVKRVFYDDFCKRLLNEHGLDVSKCSRAVQEAVFSNAVHYGFGGAMEIFKAAMGVGAENPKVLSTMKDRELLNNIQDYKKSKPNKYRDEKNRADDERSDLLDLSNGKRLSVDPNFKKLNFRSKKTWIEQEEIRVHEGKVTIQVMVNTFRYSFQSLFPSFRLVRNLVFVLTLALVNGQRRKKD